MMMFWVKLSFFLLPVDDLYQEPVLTGVIRGRRLVFDQRRYLLNRVYMIFIWEYAAR